MPEAQVVGVPHRNVRHFISASCALADAKIRFAAQQRCLVRKAMAAARKALQTSTFQPFTDYWLALDDVLVHSQVSKGAPIACSVHLQRMSKESGTPYPTGNGGPVPDTVLCSIKESMERELTLVGKFVVTVVINN